MFKQSKRKGAFNCDCNLEKCEEYRQELEKYLPTHYYWNPSTCYRLQINRLPEFVELMYSRGFLKISQEVLK